MIIRVLLPFISFSKGDTNILNSVRVVLLKNENIVKLARINILFNYLSIGVYKKAIFHANQGLKAAQHLPERQNLHNRMQAQRSLRNKGQLHSPPARSGRTHSMSCLSDSWYCPSFFRRSMTRGYEDLAFQAFSQILIGIFHIIHIFLLKFSTKNITFEEDYT
ncbi:hypothetical protein D0T84_16710 [Dysgonomonas sp. 521]|uniref:hypothetical protein n=1 Tax=Dysgonomonas sp. 521 TaxID=2302932 RepID=UPI0013D1E928|nr:hypothetical protein [Dysgonomonas sp. 521]NDV96544.1 hypothetical protein [Dysgonomonas sp. 521]